MAHVLWINLRKARNQYSVQEISSFVHMFALRRQQSWRERLPVTPMEGVKTKLVCNFCSRQCIWKILLVCKHQEECVLKFILHTCISSDHFYKDQRMSLIFPAFWNPGTPEHHDLGHCYQQQGSLLQCFGSNILAMVVSEDENHHGAYSLWCQFIKVKCREYSIFTKHKQGLYKCPISI
nr:uncharacterized protein LOC113733006 [Coffea arabica]